MRDPKPRERGVSLFLLDFTDVLAGAQRNVAEDEKVELSFEPYAAQHGPDGTLYVICSEGVGWPVTKEDPLELGLYVRTPHSFGMFPRWNAVLSPAEVAARMRDEQIDLADLVRRFGQRLEDNFWIWHRTMSGVRA